jgi:hypothetical protein
MALRSKFPYSLSLENPCLASVQFLQQTGDGAVFMKGLLFPASEDSQLASVLHPRPLEVSVEGCEHVVAMTLAVPGNP